jgi:hypothetical protein
MPPFNHQSQQPTSQLKDAILSQQPLQMVTFANQTYLPVIHNSQQSNIPIFFSEVANNLQGFSQQILPILPATTPTQWVTPKPNTFPQSHKNFTGGSVPFIDPSS